MERLATRYTMATDFDAYFKPDISEINLRDVNHVVSVVSS